MKALKWIGLTAVAGLVVLVVVMFLGNQPGQRPPDAADTPALAFQSPDAQPPPIASAPERPGPARPVVVAPTPPSVAAVIPENGAAPASTVRVKPAQTLAKVNGVAITLRDLVALPKEKEDAEQIMSAEMYRFLLNRAVEREVTFQAAKTKGVELTAAQRQQLADLRARSGQRELGVFDTVQQNPANVEFEQRDSAALLLQAALAEKAGVPSPHVTAAQVRVYYQQHEAAYGALPANLAERQTAWEKIDQAIRQKLAPQVQAEHQERFQKFVEQLKGAAQIDMPTP